MTDVLEHARETVLNTGRGLDEPSVVGVLTLDEGRLGEALALAHEVRLRWCGPEVEVEGICRRKTGGCPEDCHFCSQSGRFDTPVRATPPRHPVAGAGRPPDGAGRRQRVLHRRWPSAARTRD